jgi:hypothetical protein
MNNCKLCGAGDVPEWSTDAKVWIHRRENLDRRCDNPPADWAIEDKDGGFRECSSEAEARGWIKAFPELYGLVTRRSAGGWTK